MIKEQLLSTLHSIYDWPISDESAWKAYNNFVDICNSDDLDMYHYLFELISLDRNGRLKLRNRLAERGFELRPDEVDQYIFLIVIAMTAKDDVTIENF